MTGGVFSVLQSMGATMLDITDETVAGAIGLTAAGAAVLRSTIWRK